MEDTATPLAGPVDAPASDNSIENIVAEIQSGGGSEPANDVEGVTQELVNEAEGNGEPDEGPETEDDATEPAEEPEEAEESSPEESEAPDPFAKLVTENPDLTVKVKVNGETIEVPIAELTNGYSRTEDYKAKTAALADERRQVEQQRETVEATVKAEYANQLEEATNLFAQFDPVLSEAAKIDWNALKQADPAAFVAAQDAVNERLTAIQQMKQHVEKIRGETSQRQEQMLQQERIQRFDTTAVELVKERPELADEAKITAFVSESADGLKSYGFTQQEILDVFDHRVARLIDDARYGRAQREAAKALPQNKVVPKSAVKPLTSDGAGSRASKPRFPATADRHAKGAFIADRILSEL